MSLVSRMSTASAGRQRSATRPNPWKISPMRASGLAMPSASPTPSRDFNPPATVTASASPKAASARKLPFKRPRLPALRSMRPCPSPTGLRVTMLSAPPRVLRPESVPWGPRTTSTRSMFSKSMLAPMLRPR